MVDPMFLHFFLPMNKKNSPYNCSHMVSTFWLVKPPASPLSTGLGTYWELSTNNVLVIFPPTIFMLKNLRLGCVEWLSIVLGIVREFYYQTPPLRPHVFLFYAKTQILLYEQYTSCALSS